MRKLLLGSAVIFALAGCDEGQESALSQCEFSALSTYKDGWQTWGPESKGYLNYIRTCMKANGFENNVRPHRCTIGFFSEHNSACYSPTGTTSYFMWRIRVPFDGGLIGPSLY